MILIGQCGFPKSGNYLLYKILKSIMIQINEFDSYIGSLTKINHHGYKEAGKSFSDEMTVDHIRINDGMVILKNGPVFMKKNEIINSITVYQDQFSKFHQMAKIIWTHQKPIMEHFQLLHPDRKWFYLIRDGKDVINSYFHYSVSERMLKLRPDFKMRTLDQLYNNMNYFRSVIQMWIDHVDSYLKLRDNYMLIRYEDLIFSKEKIIKNILNALEIRLCDVDIDSILQLTQKKIMRADSPNHVREKKTGGWEKFFSKSHLDIYTTMTRNISSELCSV